MSEPQHLEEADLDAYLQRIGYQGEAAPTLATLHAIHYGHATSIAFENLTPLLRQPVRLDLPALLEKLVYDGRGGWCFEQNLLLSHALRALGFRVSGLAARVRWNVPDEVITARSHMLRVELDEGSYIADVGFGGLTLTAPLRLIPDKAQTTPHEPFRLIERGVGYALQAQLGEEWPSNRRAAAPASSCPPDSDRRSRLVRRRAHSSVPNITPWRVLRRKWLSRWRKTSGWRRISSM